MIDPALWKRLQAHDFDAIGTAYPYFKKLASAEGWDRRYTDDVIQEYRRFLYLTQISDGQVTPSVAIDRAWHVHLTFTRNYWDRLCRDVLGGPLHHEPCAGSEDMPRYQRQFVDTKSLYVQEFGRVPPAHIWGGDTTDTPAKRAPMAGLYGISAGAILLFSGSWVVVGVLAVVVVFILYDAVFGARIRNKRRKNHRGGDGSGSPGGCSSGGCDVGGGGGGCGGGSG